MNQERKLWIAFILITTVSLGVLGYYGHEIYQKAPPLPQSVVTTTGEVIFKGQDIKDGQNVWQSMGGQEVGSVWGHGAYLAPKITLDDKDFQVLSLIYKLIYFVSKDVQRNTEDSELQRISFNLFLYELKFIFNRYTTGTSIKINRPENLTIQFLTILT